MNQHLAKALAQAYIDERHRAAAARQRPHPRRRRHTLRPRNAISRFAHLTRLLRHTP
jgi:hypothetical protein